MICKINKIEKLIDFSSKLEILLVEDNSDVRVQVSKMLSNFFKKVHIANDGVDGLNKYNEFYKVNNRFYDMVISDIKMPNMNGVELCKKINTINSSQIILILSANTKSNELIDLINIGISKFISKPINPKTLVDSIASALEKLEILWNSKNSKTLLEKIVILESEKKVIEKLAITDKLTQLNNRHYIDSYLYNEILYTKRYDSELSIILIDIDDFKIINDTYGHSKGDEVLVIISNILKKFVRESDIIGRWGGEEFIIICKKTNLSGCFQLAEYIRNIISNTEFSVKKKITASFGVASYEKDELYDSLIQRTDKALYKSKNTGKNKVTFS